MIFTVINHVQMLRATSLLPLILYFEAFYILRRCTQRLYMAVF